MTIKKKRSHHGPSKAPIAPKKPPVKSPSKPARAIVKKKEDKITIEQLEAEIYAELTPEQKEAKAHREKEKSLFFKKLRLRAGRKTTLNEELIFEIYGYLKVPNYVETAVALAGIPKDNFYEWAKRGARERHRIDGGGEPNPDEHLYLLFSDAVKRGQAEGEARLVRLTSQAAGTQWAAGMTLLERMHPGTFGRQRVELTGADGKDLQVGIPTVILVPSNGRYQPKEIPDGSVIDGTRRELVESTKIGTSIESQNCTHNGGKGNLVSKSLSKGKLGGK